MEKADAILDMLTDEDADHLEAELSDPSNFGMAKSLFMAGEKAGFDMTDEDDLNRFIIAYNASLLAQSAAGAKKTRSTTSMRRAALIQRQSQRVGRNDPCSCGSGRKYKKCCSR